MVWSTALALVWLVGVEPAPVEDPSASPVPPTSHAESSPEPVPLPAEGATTPSPFDELAPQPPPPRGDRADLFDPWEVPLQSVVPRPAPRPRSDDRTDPPLLDPWRPPGPGHVSTPRSPDLRHPFATAARDAASFATQSPDDALPTAAPAEPAPRLAHADLRDPFAGPSSTRAAVPVASPADLRDPFGARRRTVAPPATPSLPEVDVAAEAPPLSPG